MYIVSDSIVLLGSNGELIMVNSRTLKLTIAGCYTQSKSVICRQM